MRFTFVKGEVVIVAMVVSDVRIEKRIVRVELRIS